MKKASLSRRGSIKFLKNKAPAALVNYIYLIHLNLEIEIIGISP